MNKNTYTTELFIEKAKMVHGDKYDYSKVEYKNSTSKVCIVCPEHGEFLIQPSNHLSGQGCRLCGIKKRNEAKRKTTETFIKEAQSVHANKYDYSKVKYIGCDDKICIICPEHGEFWQTPYIHLKSVYGCPKCAGNYQYTTEEFKKKATEIHGNKYDYAKTEYFSAFEKVCIICPEHGEFWQTPATHLRGAGCPKCYGLNKSTEDFITELKEKGLFNENYDFSYLDYNGAFECVRLICNRHGDFMIRPHDLLRGHGCPKCGSESAANKQRLTVENFVRKSRRVHGSKYDYSKVVYKNATTPVCVICPNHGEFYVKPNKHTSSSRTGCPKCAESMLERNIRVFCENNNINFIQQKRFPWLGLQSYDFYLPDYNVAVECQGTYHFEPFYKLHEGCDENEHLLMQIQRDELKFELSKENNVNLYYYVPENLIKKTALSKIYQNTFNVFTKPEDLNDIINKFNDLGRSKTQSGAI